MTTPPAGEDAGRLPEIVEDRQAITWKSSKLPVDALYDERLSANAIVTLGKLYEIAWDGSGSHPEGETPPLDFGEVAAAFGLSRSTFYAHIMNLRATGWVSTRSHSRGTVITLNPRIQIPGPTATIDIPSLNNNEDIRRSTSENPKYRILSEAGIGEPLRSLLSDDPEISIEYLEAHIRYTELRRDPIRLLAYRLKVRDPIPPDREFAKLDPWGEEARRIYVEDSDFSDFIER